MDKIKTLQQLINLISIHLNDLKNSTPKVRGDTNYMIACNQLKIAQDEISKITNDLECCGNCYYRERQLEDCALYLERFDKLDKHCAFWSFDGLTQKKREEY